MKGRRGREYETRRHGSAVQQRWASVHSTSAEATVACAFRQADLMFVHGGIALGVVCVGVRYLWDGPPFVDGTP